MSACARWAELSDRHAIGDALAPSEAEFMRLHVASCEACRAEASLYGALESFVDTPTRVGGEAPTAPKELPSRIVPRMPSRRPYAVAAFAVAAIAASVAVFVAVNRTAPASAPMPVASAPSVPEPPKARVTLTSGAGVEVDGRPAPAGTALVLGNVLYARAGRACVAVDPAVRVCVAPGTLLRVDDVGADRRLALLGGKLVAELEPQPKGTTFGVSTRDGAAIAVGTAFSVEVPPGDAPVVTRVLHGTVVVRSAGGREHFVHAHEAASMHDAPALLAPPDEARERALLDGTPAPALVVAPPPAVSDVDRACPPEKAPEDPAVLLAAARERRSSGDVHGAASAYRDLFARHPGSVEAHAALVPYGEMQLGSLADATGALASFDRYLASGGPLAEEASYGRIRALRALGRTSDERAAIDAFLVRFPSGALAATLRDRP